MRLPTVKGIIKRRMLVNFRADPAVVQRHLPPSFRPKLQEGRAVVGICLIRLEHMRPKGLPEIIGLSSENAAHRIAVQWDDPEGITREGVFIPRRDTNSPVNMALGGRLFPGEHHKAKFKVEESGDEISLRMKSSDGCVSVKVEGTATENLPKASIFPSLEAASSFFDAGSLGYSLTSDEDRLDGLTLETEGWKVEPLAVTRVYSSYFSDKAAFPEGSVEFDHALIMRDISSEWHNASDLHV
jgi:uncharacterized protein YqjF (DUF2071 family)